MGQEYILKFYFSDVYNLGSFTLKGTEASWPPGVMDLL